MARKGLQLAKDLKPDAITLDIRLPDMAGWTILDRLKHDPATRHIPIHVISIDDDRRRGLSLGALSYMEKGIDMQSLVEVFDRVKESIERMERTLLIVESDEAQHKRLAELIESEDVATTFVSSGREALELLHEIRFDCTVVDLNLADMSGLEFVEQLLQKPRGKEIPVIVYTGEDPPAEVADRLKDWPTTGLVRGVRSAERLLEQTAVFLHRIEDNLPEAKRRMIQQARDKKASWIAGGKVLLVDDDVRNLFALTSVMERHKLQVLHAESGQDALDILHREPDVRHCFDGHHDAADGRIRGDPQDPSSPAVRIVADHRADGKGHERRSREVHRCRRFRLHHQAGKPGRSDLDAARVAAARIRGRAKIPATAPPDASTSSEEPYGDDERLA